MSDALVLSEKKIQDRIKKAFEEFTETENVANEIAFHLTDWVEDVRGLVKLYSNIDGASDDEITHFFFKFLAHVPNHLNAAKKLSGMGKVTDVFQVGIFDDE